MKKKAGKISGITAGVLLAAGCTAMTVFAQEDRILPERFTGEWIGVNGYLSVQADAEIITQPIDKLATASVQRRSFTQEDVDRFLEVFLKGNDFYEPEQMTRQEIEAKLEEYRAMEAGEIPVTGDTTLEKIPGLIEYYTELLQTAPEAGEKFISTGEFVSDGILSYVMGWGETEEQKMQIFIQNNSLNWDQAICYEEGYGNLMGAYTNIENPYSIDVSDTQPLPEADDSIAEFTEEDAIMTGDALMKSLDMGNVVCDQIVPVTYYDFDRMLEDGNELSNPSQYIHDNGYELQYVRTVEGVPVAYTEEWGNSIPENEPYEGVWIYERITVCVNKDGVVYFQWVSPHTEPVTEETDLQLLEFEDISDIFAKMIMVKNGNLEQRNKLNGTNDIKKMIIDRVELRLMRIRNKNDLQHGRIVPVWDFCGTYADKYYMQNDNEILLTINALDGTVIDREFGY